MRSRGPSLVSTTELSSRRTFRFRSASRHKLLTIRYSQVWKLQSNRKRVQVLVHPQERFLINVVGVLGRPKQIRGQPQDILIVQAHQLLKGALIALLSRPNQLGFVHSDGRLHCGSLLQHCNRRRKTKKVTEPQPEGAFALSGQFDFDFLVGLIEFQDPEGTDLTGRGASFGARCRRRALLPFR